MSKETNSTAQLNLPEVIISGLDTPWAIDFLPGGKMIFTQRPGTLSIYDGKEAVVLRQMDVDQTGEAGLLGLAVDPDFESTKYVFVYYSDKIQNKIVRFRLEEGRLVDETILLDGIPKSRFHDGGRMRFGPDGLLYVTTGDAGHPEFSQDKDSLAGKILRLSKDGSVPHDNPFGSHIYSYGHRNSQGLAWDPDSKILYSSEHGPSGNDEINIIKIGNNYGWPDMQCDQGDTVGISQPIRCFTEFTLAPSGMEFSDGQLYVAGLRGGQIRMIQLSSDGLTVEKEIPMLADFGRIRDIRIYDGYLYFATNNRDGRGLPREGDDKIIRVRI